MAPRPSQILCQLERGPQHLERDHLEPTPLKALDHL
eukprot:CAMPEP_0181247576 /NCGR_PEP_ID=MMETSP1096-20121128/44689_1 /TAXON_ID=156174 ORGANISM="Chrysochromulina ericina, Strain CCMP281" /NCGR_SAMPLE_ID=MMETSP1096 /ASSEMBLY_ACC=CAM_ASM_000453 /LENGTH=35 /DNA_ID= /DNA_START= /DNA_END= /DNA_ORIENTATION=